MWIIEHRRNTIEELRATPIECGVEIDLRTSGGELRVAHDPLQKGEPFESWLDHFHHAGLILNVKEDGLEEMLLSCMHRRGIERFFFLDQSFPSLVRMAIHHNERRAAVRVSEYESLHTAYLLQGRVTWVWIDSFMSFSFSQRDVEMLRESGFQLCLVSPELQGRWDPQEIRMIRSQFERWKVPIDAVCTKRRALWSP